MKKTMNIGLVMLSALPFLNVKVGPKTGQESALDFVLAVEMDAKDNRIVQLYRHPERGAYSYRGGWAWLPNAEWRAEVERLLIERKSEVRDWEFHPSDAQGDWSFHCVSTVTIPRVATLALTDKL